MSDFRYLSLVIATLCLAIAAPASAELPQTRLGSLYPPGGQAGTTFEVRVFGEQDLEYETAPRLEFSRSDIRAEPVIDAATGVWQDKAFRVTIPSDEPAGRCEAWLAGYYGASNPRSFRIESATTKVEDGDLTADEPAVLAIDEPMYGRVDNVADVDDFVFSGEAGRTIYLRADAEELDSPLNPVLELIGPGGRRLGYNGGGFLGTASLAVVLPDTGDYRVRLTDAAYLGGGDHLYRFIATGRPVVTSIWPPAGAAGTSGVFELLGHNLPGGEPLSDASTLVRRKVEITLPAEPSSRSNSVAFDPSQASVDAFDYVFHDGPATADAVPVFASPRPLTPETEPNDDLDEALRVTVPCDVAGRFDRAHDADRFLFAAKAGEIFFIEAFARRYRSPADVVIAVDQVTGPDGQVKERRIVIADDVADALAPGVVDLATDDPLQRFEVSEDGTYLVTVRDRYFGSRGGPELAYHLSIRRPEPNFQLIVVPHRQEKPEIAASPWSVSLRQGENVVVTVYARRRDGFAGPITVTTEGLPPGVTTTGIVIAAGQTSAPLVLSAADQADRWEGPIRIIGEASLATPGGMSAVVRREARTGTVIRGGEKAPLEARLTDSLVLSVLAEELPFRLIGPGGTTRVAQGSQVLLPVRIARKKDYTETVSVSADGLPAEAKVTAEPKTFASSESEQFIRLLIDPQSPPQVRPVLLRGTGKIEHRRDPFRLMRTKAAQAAAAHALTQADEFLKTALSARDAAKVEMTTKDILDAAAVSAAKTVYAEREAAAKQAEARQKQAAQTKAAVDTAVVAAEKSAAPQKIDYVSSAPAVTLSVVAAEIELTLAVSNGGQLKRGGTTDVNVTARRRGYMGPIRLDFRTPPGAGGVEGEPTTIPANENEATLRVTAAADAATGEIPFPAIRATTETADAAPLDAPVALTVIP